MTQDVLCSPKSPNRASGTQNRFHNICPILVILALLLYYQAFQWAIERVIPPSRFLKTSRTQQL